MAQNSIDLHANSHTSIFSNLAWMDELIIPRIQSDAAKFESCWPCKKQQQLSICMVGYLPVSNNCKVVRF